MFDEDFKFGVSLSGFQFEMGGSKVDPNTDWYHWSTNDLNAFTGLVSGDNPKNGPNYWENYEIFHQLAEDAGMNSFRIGLEWSRVFPEATFGTDRNLESLADMEAVAHYKEILKNIKSRDIDVMVDLNHFTLPAWAHDPLAVNRNRDMEKPGWVDERLPEEFKKFARFSVRQFDEYADSWSTMNEPNVVANLGYLSPKSGFPPAIIAPEMFEKAMKNQAQAHNLAYEAMKEETDRPVGIIYATVWMDGDDSAEAAFEYSNYRFLDRTMGSSDFLGVNYYTRSVVEKRDEALQIGRAEVTWKDLSGYGYACPLNGSSRAGRFATDIGWEYYPEGLEKVLLKLADRYEKPMFVTENGTADAQDNYRPFYLLGHLEVLENIEDQVDLRGYYHWSLVDNFEWAEGFDKRFGLVYVDFEDKKYIPRPSYYLYREIIKQGTVEDQKQLLDLLDGEGASRV
ncbi:MAG: family 1 glycosylhydrolase [Candidatus Bipolaricaulota bacterium]